MKEVLRISDDEAERMGLTLETGDDDAFHVLLVAYVTRDSFLAE